MIGVDDLVIYLNLRRKEYIRACGLDQNRVISKMRSGKKFLEHCTRIYLERNSLDHDIEKIALKLFELEEEKGAVEEV